MNAPSKTVTTTNGTKTLPQIYASVKNLAMRITTIACLLFSSGQLMAQDGGPGVGRLMGIEILETIIYSVIGIIMAVIGFKVVDWLTPGDLADEVAHKENRALAILAGAMMLGVCIIIASVLVA